jgi:hypothetical protein
MRAPKYQRAEMLEAVVNRAVMSLRDPIDRIEMLDGRFVVSAGKDRLVLHCVWINGVSGDGLPLLGDGVWVARTEDDVDGQEPPTDLSRTALPPERSSILCRIFASWLRRSL